MIIVIAILFRGLQCFSVSGARCLFGLTTPNSPGAHFAPTVSFPPNRPAADSFCPGRKSISRERRIVIDGMGADVIAASSVRDSCYPRPLDRTAIVSEEINR